MNRALLTISIYSCFFGAVVGQLYIGQNALLHVSEGANLEIGGNLENNGAIQNIGTISLYGNWTINNNFNGQEGELQFLGNEDQMIEVDELVLDELTINTLGSVSFPGNQYTVLDRIEFQFGTVEIGENTRFVLGENISIIGGSNDSYFEGPLIAKGSGNKVFPIGSQGIYAPLILDDIFGNELEIMANYQRNNPVDPEPGDDLLGVSHRGYWEVELLSGSTQETKVTVEFSEEDLSDFNIRNNIRHRFNSPTIALAETLADRWRSIGASEILDSDSLTFGTITSESTIAPLLNDKLFLAVGLGPIAPENGLWYLPQVFSPNASDPDNRAFKLFGSKITDENFKMQVYNKLGVLVYSANTFSEANENGWDGTNPSGADEPTGVYYYSIRLTFERGNEVNKGGAFYLVR